MYFIDPVAIIISGILSLAMANSLVFKAFLIEAIVSSPLICVQGRARFYVFFYHFMAGLFRCIGADLQANFPTASLHHPNHRGLISFCCASSTLFETAFTGLSILLLDSLLSAGNIYLV
jgi:hypothetical protein